MNDIAKYLNKDFDWDDLWQSLDDLFQDEGEGKSIGTETLQALNGDEETEMFVISDVMDRDKTDIFVYYDKEYQVLEMRSWGSDSIQKVSDEELLHYANILTVNTTLSVSVMLDDESKTRPLCFYDFIHTNHYDKAWKVKEAIMYFSMSLENALGIDEDKEFYGDEWTYLEGLKES
jgi:hypothetical protein